MAGRLDGWLTGCLVTQASFFVFRSGVPVCLSGLYSWMSVFQQAQGAELGGEEEDTTKNPTQFVEQKHDVISSEARRKKTKPDLCH